LYSYQCEPSLSLLTREYQLPSTYTTASSSSSSRSRSRSRSHSRSSRSSMYIPLDALHVIPATTSFPAKLVTSSEYKPSQSITWLIIITLDVNHSQEQHRENLNK